MARKVKADGRAIIKSFSYPDSEQNRQLYRFIGNVAKEKGISDSELINRILTLYYVRMKNR